MEEQTYDKKYARFVLALFAMIIVAVMYVEGMLTPSLPSIAEGFHITVDQVSLVLSTYLLTGVALSPIVGKLADLYGKKKMMSIVMLIYAGAVSVTGFSPNFTFMVISRAVQGVGLTIMPLGMAMVREEFPRKMVPRAQALISGMFGVGFAVSLPLGSFISNYYGWRMTYHTAIPFIVALAILTLWKVKESRYRRPDVKVDYVGAIALGVPLALIVLAMSEGSSWGWHSLLFLGMAITGIVLLIPMFIYERHYYHHGGEAIFDMKLLSKRNVLIANISLTISGIGMYLSMQALSYRFETPEPYGFGFSILETGISMVAFAAGMIVFSIVTGKLISRTGIKPLAIAGSIVSAIGFFMLSASPGLVMTLADEAIIGSGMAIMNASIINLLVLSVEARDMGLATSMNSTFRYIGSSIGAPIAGTVLSLYTAVDVVHSATGNVIFSFPDATAFKYAFMIGAFTFVISAFVVLLSKEVLGRRMEVVKKSTVTPSEE
ncbi:major facilitator superfamily multidrug efflux pump [Ferroplasma acidiphilum]|jgi:MFS family permease|uniref:Major facilitator superfamily multidrug efflux pump n=2 Tax=Ferroplasma acidiphilum TaxID=74969 RepID=A0A1V0N3P6_9ARCH|nr:MFS transporter [Ferroplasma acidiphilum]ARD84715.1 major facilitator superfamily multidrug efflux pump [Ferroplasma acidiphilum]